MKPVKWLFIFFIIFSHLQVSFAQVQIKQFSKAAPLTLGLKEIHNIIIDSRLDHTCGLMIHCQVKTALGAPVLGYDFPVLIVEQGMHVCNYLNTDSQNILFQDSAKQTYFQKFQSLPAGDYKVCYTGRVKFSNVVVIPLCVEKTAITDTGYTVKDSSGKLKYIPPGGGRNTDTTFRLLKLMFEKKAHLNAMGEPPAGVDTAAIRKAKEAYIKKVNRDLKKPGFKFEGNAMVSYNYSPQKTITNQYPTHFVTSDIAPHFMLYGIPVGGHLFFTYDDLHPKPFINQFNLSFDQRQFQEGLKARVSGLLNTGAPGLPTSLPGLPGLNSSMFNEQSLINKNISPFGNSTYDISSFNNFDKTVIQKYRYDQEGLLRYKDSLQWTDPTKAKQFSRITDQIQYQNTLKILEQQDAAAKLAYEDSLRKRNPDQYSKFKDMEAANLLGNIEQNKWPSNPDDIKKVVPLSKAESLFYNVQTCNIGKSYLYYTPLSIQGVAVTGADIAYTPGRFFVEGTYGVLDMTQSLWFQDAYHQKYTVTGARLGLGRPGKTHFHIIVMDFAAIGPMTVDTGFNQRLPQRNTLIGAEALFSPVRNLTLKMECFRAINIYSDLVNENTQNPYAAYGAKDWLSNEALHVSSEYKIRKTGTVLTCDFNRIGAEYQTLGNPYLRNDIIDYGIHASQSFFKNRVTVVMGCKEEQDNLAQTRDSSSRNTFYDGRIAVSFPRLPVFNMSYTPVYFYKRYAELPGYHNYALASNLSVSASYNKTIVGRNINSSVLFSRIVNENSISEARFDLYTYMVNENLMLSSTSAVSGLFSYSVPKQGSDSLKVLTLDFSYKTLLWKKLNQTFGLKMNRIMSQDLVYVYLKSTLQIKSRYAINAYIYQNIAKADARLQNNLIQVSGSMSW